MAEPFPAKEGTVLLPMVVLLERGQLAVEELVGQLGQAALQDDAGLRERLLGIVMRGVSTRHYREVLPEVAQRCGVSHSAVSRQLEEASAEALQRQCERRFEEVDLLIIYLDGKAFGGHQVICAVGVDLQGKKHILGLTEGATENAVVVKELLEDLVERGVSPGRKRLFVSDGSKALRNWRRWGSAIPPTPRTNSPCSTRSPRRKEWRRPSSASAFSTNTPSRSAPAWASSGARPGASGLWGRAPRSGTWARGGLEAVL